MNTESDQSSENRHPDSSPEEEQQRTGLFRWNDSDNLMPPWSVPPGLMVPGPREPQADDAQESRPPTEPAAMPAVEPAADEQAGGEPSADDDSWPGVAPPAGWFLQTPQPAPQPPSAASPDSDPDTASDLPGVALPAPRREPDGSWSSPLTPKPAPQPLGPTQARYGRAGRPGTPAHPSRFARRPGAGPPGPPGRGSTFPVATVPSALGRGRHPVGAAPGPATTASPAPGSAPNAPVDTPAGAAAARRRPPRRARTGRARRRTPCQARTGRARRHRPARAHAGPARRAGVLRPRRRRG